MGSACWLFTHCACVPAAMSAIPELWRSAKSRPTPGVACATRSIPLITGSWEASKHSAMTVLEGVLGGREQQRTSTLARELECSPQLQHTEQPAVGGEAAGWPAWESPGESPSCCAENLHLKVHAAQLGPASPARWQRSRGVCGAPMASRRARPGAAKAQTNARR